MLKFSKALALAVTLALPSTASAQAFVSTGWAYWHHGRSARSALAAHGVLHKRRLYIYADGYPAHAKGAAVLYPDCGSGVSDSHVVATYSMKRVQGGYRDAVLRFSQQLSRQPLVLE